MHGRPLCSQCSNAPPRRLLSDNRLGGRLPPGALSPLLPELTWLDLSSNLIWGPLERGNWLTTRQRERLDTFTARRQHTHNTGPPQLDRL